jgi:thymidylate synthase (FAD)
MKILKPKYEILTPISDGAVKELKHIERIGRVCYKSEDKITEDGESAKKFCKMLVERGHEAMIEHSTLSVLFTVDRGVSHEMVRHRIASFAQESTRYVNYSKDKFGNEIGVIDIMGGIERDKSMCDEDADLLGEIYTEWLRGMEDAEKHYMKLIELGATPQIARSVLPNSTKTNITITANYREWRNFFKLRTSLAAHPQIREVAVPLLKELQQKIPVIFDDIEVAENA